MEQQEQITLTPKLIFQKIIGAKYLLVKNWWVILLLTGIGAAIGFYVDAEKNKRIKYKSKITFNVSGASSGQDAGGFAPRSGDHSV